MQEVKRWSLQIAGREMTVETGLFAGQANGAAVVRYGDTQVLATATMSKGMGFAKGYFPLMVDYEERYYAAGKIKGSRFIKREGRPSDEAVLTGRAVDRTIRPLFEMRMRNDVQVIITAQSFDGENDPDIVSIIAASAALSISDIPWKGPVAAVRVGMVKGEIVINPTREEMKESRLDMVLSGTAEKINMIETGAKEVPEEDIVKAFEAGHTVIAEVAELIAKIRGEVGKPKAEPTRLAGSPEMEAKMRETILSGGLEEALYGKSKDDRERQVRSVQDAAKERVLASLSKEEVAAFDGDLFDQVVDEVADEIVHKNILSDEKRPDLRSLTEVRPIACQVGVLPRPHGTGLFTRGETQVLTVTTLGAPGDEQIIDTMETDEKKRYIHHYNFPPYSVGEVRPMRGPGRREVGHGALAEKALLPVLPDKEKFPYTMLLVSEVLSSNGSSSMASTCGSALSLMHAGVPITAPVSGIAMGIIIEPKAQSPKQRGAEEEKPRYKVLSDIQGAEDHYGDMDFKVAGTKQGITALQMDVKVDGVDLAMLRAALAQAREGRMHILEKMLAVIPEPNKEMSPYAPRIIVLHINPDKIRDVIGPGGKVINAIIDETGVEIDIEDDGSVFITSADEGSAAKAKKWIENLTHEVKAGERFDAKVTRIMNFGAFAEILPGQEGLIHISELAEGRVEKVEDVVKVGDVVPVKVKEIDRMGRINLSMKDAAGK